MSNKGRSGAPNLRGMSEEQYREIFPPTAILTAYRGSIAHGMYVPQSDPNSIDDKDIMTVFVGPLGMYLGRGLGETDINKFVDEWDVVGYEVRKFVSLLLKNNPNVLSMLWLEPKHYIEVHPVGQMLLDNRDLFVSKKAYHSFTGYAHAQFKKMTHHAFEGYMGEKRKGLVKKYGYDCKNAAHLIRLLKMGIEFLTEGKLYVERQDAAELLSIKRGEWPLEAVQERAKHLFNLAEEAYVRSTLPAAPASEAVDLLLQRMLKTYFNLEDRSNG